MRSTLVLIPHADPFFGIPVFGMGWMLAVLIVVALALVVVRVRRVGWKWEALSELPLLLLLCAAIVWGARWWKNVPRPAHRWAFRFAATVSWCCWGLSQACPCWYMSLVAWDCIPS